MRTVLYRQSHADGREFRTVSFNLAMTVVTSLVMVIAFLGGARWSEKAIASQIVSLERAHDDLAHVVDDLSKSLTRLEGSMQEQATLNSTRAGRLTELDTELKLLRQQHEFYHGDRRTR